MADMGISHADADHYRSVRVKKDVTAKHKALLAVHATLLTSAFVFVAAMVFGFIG